MRAWIVANYPRNLKRLVKTTKNIMNTGLRAKIRTVDLPVTK
jgi:hypothetical protein